MARLLHLLLAYFLICYGCCCLLFILPLMRKDRYNLAVLGLGRNKPLFGVRFSPSEIQMEASSSANCQYLPMNYLVDTAESNNNCEY